MAFNHKRADFWLPNFGFKKSLLSLLKDFDDYTPYKTNRVVANSEFE